MVLEPGFSRTPDGRHIAQSLRAEEFRVVTHAGSPSHQQLAPQHLAPPCRIPRSVVWYRAIGDEDSVYTHHAAVIMPGDEAVQLLAQGQAALLQLGKQWKCVSTMPALARCDACATNLLLVPPEACSLPAPRDSTSSSRVQSVLLGTLGARRGTRTGIQRRCRPLASKRRSWPCSYGVALRAS